MHKRRDTHIQSAISSILYYFVISMSLAQPRWSMDEREEPSSLSVMARGGGGRGGGWGERDLSGSSHDKLESRIPSGSMGLLHKNWKKKRQIYIKIWQGIIHIATLIFY